jgi:hypothetical protein
MAIRRGSGGAEVAGKAARMIFLKSLEALFSCPTSMGSVACKATLYDVRPCGSNIPHSEPRTLFNHVITYTRCTAVGSLMISRNSLHLS